MAWTDDSEPGAVAGLEAELSRAEENAERSQAEGIQGAGAELSQWGD